MKKNFGVFILFFCVINTTNAQPDRWQQKVKYTIDVNLNVETNRLKGIEKIDYWNNSPDTLNRIFIHLYWNAFQPNSMMDIRSRELGQIQLGTDKKGNPVYDWDSRVEDRISKLQADEIGYDSVDYVKVNGIAQKLIYHETILEVKLSSQILPHSKTTLDVAFRDQVPIQIRRSGRNNAEGIRYSMSQWYPKISEYDYEGWNANPYIGREFYGVWGDYEVNITIDKKYLVAATGTLPNPESYQPSVISNEPTKALWKFSAQNVHDFVWAADTAYKIQTRQIKNGPLFYFIYKKVDSLEAKWTALADTIVKAYPYIAKTFGAYPYKNYSFIQGGDGFMEYPMATLIIKPSEGSSVHEFMHSWYYGMMGTNESLYPWMDEGFATFAELRVSAWLRGDSTFPYKRAYDSYFKLVKSNYQEPLTTHADHYNTNYAYETAAYSEGCIFLSQLGYIVGNNVLDKILLEYYNEWKFKHPNPNDFIRLAEKVSGIELQWYKEYWINSTKTIDYALGNVSDSNGKAAITLKRIGLMPMPIDVLITYKDGTREMHNIPMNLMYGNKTTEDKTIPFIVHDEWKWVNREYILLLNRSVADIRQVEIDPGMRMADMNRINNKIVVPGAN